MKRKKRWLVALIVVVAILLVTGIAVSVFLQTETGKAFRNMLHLFDNNVSIVERNEQPKATIPPVTSDEELEFLDTVPDDDSYDVELEDPEEMTAPIVADIYKTDQKHEDIINVLVLGQDGKHYRETSNRTDVMLLASYNTSTSELKLVSFQRDSYVPITGYDRWNRLNACYHFGGAGMAINTFNDLFDLDIQYYVTVAFSEFKTLVDAVGGVELEVSSKEASQIGCRSGRVTLNGEQALSYCRTRATGNGDWGRAERHRKFMIALITKIRSEFTLEMANELMTFAGDYVRTNIPVTKLASLGFTLMQNRDLHFSTAKVPFDDTWQYARKRGASVLVFDIEENARLLNEFLYGEEDS